MKIACLQYAPTYGDVDTNISRVDEILSTYCITGPGVIDVLILPEMALTGYTFRSPEEVRQFSENVSELGDDTKTCNWAIHTGNFAHYIVSAHD